MTEDDLRPDSAPGQCANVHPVYGRCERPAETLTREREALFELMQAERPPDEVFRFFQRLHGLPEVGAPKSAAEAKLAEAEKALGNLAQFIEGRHKEGDTDYQAALIARAALRSLRGEGE